MASGHEKKFDKMSLQKKMEWIRKQPDIKKIGYYNRMTSESDKEAVKKGIPGLSHLLEINEGNTGSTSSKQGGALNRSEKLPWQLALQKNAGRLSQTGLEDIINQLGQHYESPINNQMQQMFGHLQNPIMQGLLNPQHGNMAGGSLFPDRQALELQQYQQQNPQGQYEQSPMMGLLSALGNHAFKQHAVPWLNELTEEDLQKGYGDYIEPGLNRAYQGAQNAWGGAQGAGQKAWGSFKDWAPFLGAGAGLGALAGLGHNAYDRYNR